MVKYSETDVETILKNNIIIEFLLVIFGGGRESGKVKYINVYDRGWSHQS